MPKHKGIKMICSMLTGLILFLGLIASAIEGNDDSAALARWDTQALNGGETIRVSPPHYITGANTALLTGDDAYGYAEGAVRLQAGDSFEIKVDLQEEGNYHVYFDTFILTEGLFPTEVRVQVNGEDHLELRRIVLKPLWQSASQDFPRDRYGNEVMLSQIRADVWQSIIMQDPNALNPEPLEVHLRKGENTVRVTVTNGELLSGSVTFVEAAELPAYGQYASQFADVPRLDSVLKVIEAEKPDYKNDTTINSIASRDLEARPYSTNTLLLNTLGGTTWDQSGQTVYYDIEVEHAGLYQLAVKYKQSDKPNSRVFRTFTVNGNVPFQEAKNYPFNYSADWKTEVLGSEEGPYLFYLKEGVNRIGIMADASPYYGLLQLLRSAIQQVNDIDLEIRKLVGNDIDRNRDWEIADYMPNLEADLLEIAQALRGEYAKALAWNGGEDSSKGLVQLKMAANTLERLAADTDQIPHRLQELNGGAGSVTSSLSLAIQDFEIQPLTLDQIYVSSPNPDYPDYSASWFSTFIEGIKRFLHTFFPAEEQQDDDHVTLEVWMNRPRNYMDLLQRMADEQFTPQTGIRVNFSTLPNEQRLTLAAASGTAPDVAIGISNYIPFDLGIRGAALDLRQFEDFAQVAEPFSPGAFLSLTVNEQVFGMPETQDFFVLFYRKDVLESLNIPVPETWGDVIEILPELQRYGMNFYTPIAGASGSKPFTATAPFIYQQGGDVYGRDAFEIGLDSKESLEGIQLMTDLFTIYGLPMQIPNFFEHFRTGKLPLGIGNFATYVQLQVAAPELAGSWSIAPAPGLERNGEMVRWQPGSAQVSMIFAGTEHPDESWAFLKWWLSTETQVQFGTQLQTLYGKEFLWNTANTEAFRQGYMPEEDKQVILAQWEWLREVAKTPSAYMIERELSNIWTRVVFDGDNIRSAVEESINEINKETVRKMEEFGNMRNGEIIIPYRIPTIEDVKGWVGTKDGN